MLEFIDLKVLRCKEIGMEQNILGKWNMKIKIKIAFLTRVENSYLKGDGVVRDFTF